VVRPEVTSSVTLHPDGWGREAHWDLKGFNLQLLKARFLEEAGRWCVKSVFENRMAAMPAVGLA